MPDLQPLLARAIPDHGGPFCLGFAVCPGIVGRWHSILPPIPCPGVSLPRTASCVSFPCGMGPFLAWPRAAEPVQLCNGPARSVSIPTSRSCPARSSLLAHLTGGPSWNRKLRSAHDFRIMIARCSRARNRCVATRGKLTETQLCLHAKS